MQRRDQRVPDRANITLDGWMKKSTWGERRGAIAVEDRYRSDPARKARPRDDAAGRTLDGPQLTDPQTSSTRRRTRRAKEASTGEQKALLISLVLAHAGTRHRDDGHHAAGPAR